MVMRAKLARTIFLAQARFLSFYLIRVVRLAVRTSYTHIRQERIKSLHRAAYYRVIISKDFLSPIIRSIFWTHQRFRAIVHVTFRSR